MNINVNMTCGSGRNEDGRPPLSFYKIYTHPAPSHHHHKRTRNSVVLTNTCTHTYIYVHPKQAFEAGRYQVTNGQFYQFVTEASPVLYDI